MLSKSSVLAEMDVWTGGVREGVESTSWPQKLNIQLHATAFLFYFTENVYRGKKILLGFWVSVNAS